MVKKVTIELHPGKINKDTRKEIHDREAIIWDVVKGEKERLKRFSKRKEEVGLNDFTRKAILEGSTDRLLAVLYVSNKYQDKQMQGAYREGFFDHGTRELLGKLDILSEDELTAIGYNDYLCGIKMDDLAEAVRKNDFYAAGYLSAVISDSNKKCK